MPLPPRNRVARRVIFSAKTWVPPESKDEKFATLRWVAGMATLLEGHWRSLLRAPRSDDWSCGLSQLWRPMQAMLHVEIILTYACTYDEAVGPGSCEAPGCTRFVAPHHAVAYTAGVSGGVVAKESPRQSEPGAWNWFEVADVTDQEFYRLKLYAHAVLGAGYRNVDPLAYRCSGQTLFGVDATRSWRYYLRHPVVYADWAQFTSCLSDRVFVSSEDTERARALCAQFQALIRAPIRFVADDVDAGALLPADAANVLPSEAAYRPPHVQLTYATPPEIHSYAYQVAVEQADVHVTNLLGAALADVLADDVPKGVAALFEATRTAHAKARAEGKTAREQPTMPRLDPIAADATEGRFNLHEYIRAKLRLWSNVTREILEAQQEVREYNLALVGLDDSSGSSEARPKMRRPPSQDTLALAKDVPLITLQYTCAQLGLAPPKEFTCCEVVAAMLMFAGIIRTGIDPRTTLLNNIHRQLLRSNRLRSPWQGDLRYDDVIPVPTTAPRFDAVEPARKVKPSNPPV